MIIVYSILVAVAFLSAQILAIEPPVLNYTYFNMVQLGKTYTFQSTLYMTLDSSRLIIYPSHYQQKPIVYNLYTWQALNNVQAYYFAESVNHLLFFNDAANISSALYSTSLGEITVRKYKQMDEFEDNVVYRQLCQSQDIDIAVSSDGKKWARSCYSGNHILVGSVDLAQEVQAIEVKSRITSVMWRPESQDLIFAWYVKRPDNGMVLQILNRTSNITSLIYKSNQPIKILFLSPSGLLYFRTNTSFIYSYNFTSSQLWHHQSDLPIVSIQKRGNFIVLDVPYLDDHWEYYYQFGVVRFTEENVFFKIHVSRPSFGSTSQGTFLFAQTRLNDGVVDIEIYKLCNQKGWYYDAEMSQCNPCDLSCLNCQYKSTSCVSCHKGSYISTENHSCLECSSAISNCVSCSTHTICQFCIQRYIPYQSLCQLCSSILQGCSRCQSPTICIQCQQSYKLDDTSFSCRQKTSHTWIIILSVATTVLVLGLVLFKICQKRKKKEEQENNKSILLKDENKFIDDSQLQD